MPIATMARMPNMKAYVGIANATPDSRMPRRLSSTMIATTDKVVPTRCWAIQPNAGVDARFSTPADVDTATVRT